MELYQRDFFMQRIICGYQKYKTPDGQKLFIYEPNSEILYDAQDIYLEVLKECLDDGVQSSEQLLAFLYECGLWNDSLEHEADTRLPQEIDDLKVDLYNNSFDEFKVTTIREQLKNTKEKLVSLYYQKHAYDYTTAEGVATFMKNYFITQSVVKNSKKEDYDWEELDVLNLLSYRDKHSITDDNIREIAKYSDWKTHWYASKANHNLFDRLSVDLSHEQKRLIFWSTFYDNLSEHPDVPPEKIINDNDMIDGWVVIQRRKREKEKADKDIHNKLGSDKMKKHGEMFVVARDDKHAQQIEGLNSVQGHAIKQARVNQITKKGEISEGDFNDVKTRKAMDALRKGNQMMRNK